MDTDKPKGMALSERWVTLRELAEIRGISQHSAARLVRRHGWRRQTDNRGHVQALVPEEALDIPPAGAVTRRELTAALEPLTGLLREQLEHERARADRERARADAAETRAASLQAELAVAKQAADQARADAQETRQALEALRQADQARQASGRWARIRARLGV